MRGMKKFLEMPKIQIKHFEILLAMLEERWVRRDLMSFVFVCLTDFPRSFQSLARSPWSWWEWKPNWRSTILKRMEWRFWAESWVAIFHISWWSMHESMSRKWLVQSSESWTSGATEISIYQKINRSWSLFHVFSDLFYSCLHSLSTCSPLFPDPTISSLLTLPLWTSRTFARTSDWSHPMSAEWKGFQFVSAEIAGSGLNRRDYV